MSLSMCLPVCRGTCVNAAAMTAEPPCNRHSRLPRTRAHRALSMPCKSKCHPPERMSMQAADHTEHADTPWLEVTAASRRTSREWKPGLRKHQWQSTLSKGSDALLFFPFTTCSLPHAVTSHADSAKDMVLSQCSCLCCPYSQDRDIMIQSGQLVYRRTLMTHEGCAESSASALLSRPEAGPKLLEALERSRQPAQLQQVLHSALQSVTLPGKASLDDLRLTINVVRTSRLKFSLHPWLLLCLQQGGLQCSVHPPC